MLGHLIYSYNHLDDARIQQEISKKLYAPEFDGVKIAHSHNGKSSFGYRKYQEDVLIRRKNIGHFDGAADLIDVGMKWFMENKVKGLRYVLVTAADTWCLDSKWLRSVVDEMQAKGQVLACSSWGHTKPADKPTGFSTDFFIVDIEWAKKHKIFPLDYKGFKKKFTDIFLLMWAMPVLEVCLQYRFSRFVMDAYKDNEVLINRHRLWRRIIEREPVMVGNERISDWPGMGLYTNPDPTTKRKALIESKAVLGENAEKLVKAVDLSYYNNYL